MKECIGVTKERVALGRGDGIKQRLGMVIWSHGGGGRRWLGILASGKRQVAVVHLLKKSFPKLLPISSLMVLEPIKHVLPLNLSVQREMGCYSPHLSRIRIPQPFPKLRFSGHPSKDFPLALNPKRRDTRVIAQVGAVPHPARQISPEIEITGAKMRSIQSPDLRESRPPVVVSGQLQVQVANGRIHALISDLKLVHHASLKWYSRHVINNLRVQRVHPSYMFGIKVVYQDVIGVYITKP
nr:hypothetical protein Iba_chr07cCG3120 [Ipomoea batatas]